MWDDSGFLAKKGNLIEDGYTGKLFGKKSAAQERILVGIPLTGLVRAEWMIARYGQVIPCNWSQTDCIHWLDQNSPIGFLVADARNIIATECVEQKFEWLFFIDHDVILPPTTVLKLNERMLKADIPMWSGLYFSQSLPSEPLIYRGRGNSYYNKWKMGEKVWVDGIPMGCTMIHSSILKVLYDESESYNLMGKMVKKIFVTPARTWFDPESSSWFNAVGTEDLELCTRIMKENILKKAGWPKLQRKKYPFMVDTSIFCRHIDFNGKQYPSAGEEREFI